MRGGGPGRGAGGQVVVPKVGDPPGPPPPASPTPSIGAGSMALCLCKPLLGVAWLPWRLAHDRGPPHPVPSAVPPASWSCAPRSAPSSSAWPLTLVSGLGVLGGGGGANVGAGRPHMLPDGRGARVRTRCLPSVGCAPAGAPAHPPHPPRHPGCGKSTFMRRMTGVFGGSASPPAGARGEEGEGGRCGEGAGLAQG